MWEATEEKIIAILRPQLGDYLREARLAHLLVEQVAEAVAPLKESSAVQVRLLLRISQDLRVIEICCERSYTLQALSLASMISNMRTESDISAQMICAPKAGFSTASKLKPSRSACMTPLLRR